MHYSIPLITAAFAALAQAGPVPSGSTHVLPRAGDNPPKPSSYPLGDACENEWRYLNFDKDKDDDVTKLKRLHRSVCDGPVRGIADYGWYSAQKNLAPYKRYFGDDNDEDTKATVTQVLQLISGTHDTGIGAVVGKFIVDNKDFAKDMNGEDDCETPDVAAYTNTDDLDGRQKFHFCPASYKLMNVAEVDCDSLHPYPSEDKMDAFQRVVLHEMMHSSLVGPETPAGQIRDVRNDDGNVAYFPDRTHGLVDPDQDDQPVKAEFNADSYAWLAVDAYVSYKCSPSAEGDKWAKFFKKDPPPYESDDSE